MTTNVSSPGFKSIADDFVAPSESTQPYQLHLARVRNAYATLDTKWLGLKRMLGEVEFSAEEQSRLTAMEVALFDLHSAILNRSVNPNPILTEEPAKDAKPTY